LSNSIQHIITCEFPPQPGGVSDFTRLVADGLTSKGVEVHVWCPEAIGELAASTGTVVHRKLDAFTPGALGRMSRELNKFPRPVHILVQWVPHGYGYQSLNLYFCLWLWKRAVFSGDKIQLFVHEPFLAFGEGSFKQDCAAVVHRVMIMALLMSVERVLLSVPAWEARLRPYALGRKIPFDWSPIPSNISVMPNAADVSSIREKVSPAGGLIVGHFGTYGELVAGLLAECMPDLLRNCDKCSFLLLGRGGAQFRDRILKADPSWAGRIVATGELSPEELSSHVQACDLMFQPYPDGISSRRTSAMIALAHGRPVVTTFGHLTEALWKECGAVALVDANDSAAMVQQVERLARDGRERQRLGGAGAGLYFERFAIKHTLAKLGYA
jgi:glycosyltransferase involved in cell wall biosynthesis